MLIETWSVHLKWGVLLCLTIMVVVPVLGQECSLVRSTVGTMGSSESYQAYHGGYRIQQSVGQASVIGSSLSNGLVLRQGFIQPPAGASRVRTTDPEMSVLVYPNPYTDQFGIRFDEDLEGPVEIEMMDISGRVVYQRVLAFSMEFTLMPNLLKPGTYVLNVRVGHRLFSTQILKQ